MKATTKNGVLAGVLALMLLGAIAYLRMPVERRMLASGTLTASSGRESIAVIERNLPSSARLHIDIVVEDGGSADVVVIHPNEPGAPAIDDEVFRVDGSGRVGPFAPGRFPLGLVLDNTDLHALPASSEVVAIDFEVVAESGRPPTP